MKQKASRLCPVIKVKKFKENMAHSELVQIQATREKENTALHVLNRQKEHVLDDVVRVTRARATEVQTSSAFIQKISRQIQQQEKKVQNIQLQEEEKREEVSQKSQSRKMVEKLEEKHRATLAKELERKEQRLLEVFSRRLSLGL
jgi:flagellar export protein FliJ